MLLLNRRDAVRDGIVDKSEKLAWKGFTFALTRRKIIDLFSGKTKNFFLRRLFKKAWGKHRDLPQLADKSFSQQWKDRSK